MSGAGGGGTRVQELVLTGYHGRPTAGTVVIQEFSQRQRTARAFRALGTWWGAAVVSVFIPVAHFLLVPGFAIYGLWQFRQQRRTRELARNAHGTCPDCGTEQDLELTSSRWEAPQPVTCRNCHRGLTLSLPAA